MNGVIQYHKNLDNRSKKDILNLAQNCYGHLINGKENFQTWAEKIKKHYCLKDKRNLVIYTTIKKTKGTIENYKYLGQTIIKYKK